MHAARSLRAERDAGYLDSARLAARHDARGCSLRGRAVSLMGRARASSVPPLRSFSALALPAGPEARRPSRAARDTPHHAQRAVPVADPCHPERSEGSQTSEDGDSSLGMTNGGECLRATPLGARAVMRGSSWSATSDGEPPGQRAAPGQRRCRAKARCLRAHVPSTRGHGPAVNGATASGSPPSRAERGAPRRGPGAGMSPASTKAGTAKLTS